MYVKDHMTANPVTITADTPLSKALEIMGKNHFHRLPVVDEENHVVGIITEKDIFLTFVDLMGLKRQGTRFVMLIDDKPGVFAQVTKLFAQENANVENIAVYHTDRGSEVVVKATGEVAVDKMTKILQDAGFNITNVVQTTAEGKTVVWLK